MRDSLKSPYRKFTDALNSSCDGVRHDAVKRRGESAYSTLTKEDQVMLCAFYNQAQDSWDEAEFLIESDYIGILASTITTQHTNSEYDRGESKEDIIRIIDKCLWEYWSDRVEQLFNEEYADYLVIEAESLVADREYEESRYARSH